MQITLLILALVFLCVGIALTFDIFAPIRDYRRRKAIEKSKTPDGKRSLSSTVSYYSGKKDFIMVEEVNDAKKILDETGRSAEFAKVCLQCVIFTAAGALIGLVLRSVIATAVLGVMFFMIPLWRLKLYRNKYRKYMTAQLESTTSLITVSYIRCNSFIQAVEENIDQISPIVRPKFQKFLDECKVNASVKNCVRNLRDSIDNSLFREWCEIVLKTLDNSEMKEALLPICEKYTNVKIVQDEIDAEVLGSLAEYVIMMIFMLFCYPLVYFLNAEWFAYYNTFPGKFVVGYTLIVLFFSIVKMIGILQPVDYDR
ncbi:MAG: hypothetical protein IJZ68_07065 [Bacteroidaceae bacterium]|nr:hypothetical protein [Bacteroidaceae bacterium]